MPLRYSTPKELNPSPKTTNLICTRITITPENGRIEYEFMAFDADGLKVGDVHTSDTFGETLQPEDVLTGRLTAGQVYAGLKARAYATVQDALGAGIVE